MKFLDNFYTPNPLVAVGLIVFGLCFSCWGLNNVINGWQDYLEEQEEYQQFVESGVSAEAIVTGRSTDTEYYDVGRQNRRSRKVYSLSYRYRAKPPNGESQTFNRTTRVDYSTYDEHPPDSSITIIYATNDPELSTLPDKLDQTPPSLSRSIGNAAGMFTVIGLLVMAAGGWSLYQTLASGGKFHEEFL